MAPPVTVQFQLAQADTFLYQRNFGEALKRYADALDALFNLPEERMNVLNKYIEAGIEAIQESSKNKDTYGSAILDKAKEAVVLKPTDWGAQFRLGRVLKSLGKKNEALSALNKALELDPTKESVRIVRDELETPIKPRAYMLPTFAEELEDASKVSGITITKSMAMTFARRVSGSENPNFAGLEDLIKGHQYRDGDGVVKDLRKAFDHYKLSADKGNPEGMYNVALDYLCGESVEKNFTKAFELLHIVITAPDVIPGKPCPEACSARYTLGWLHQNGVGVQRDLFKAYTLYTEASERGHASAAFQLGNMYASGEVSRDSDKAVQYWKLAAIRGTPEGMMALAFHFLRQGDFKKSNDWYEKARLTKFLPPGVEKEYKDLRQKMKLVNESLNDAEAKQNVNGCSIAEGNLWDRMKRLSPYGDLLSSVMEREGIQLHPFSITTDSKYDPKIIRHYASKGHVYAQKIYRGQTSFFKSLKLLPHAMSDSTGKYKAEFVREFAECVRNAHFICETSLEESRDMQKVVKEVLDKGGDDKDARLCWILLNIGVPKEIKRFVELSLKKYPEEPMFYDLLCSIHGFLQQFDQGAKVATDALKLFPDDINLLFDAGENYRLGLRFDEAAVYLKKFVDVAPKDHRKYPELCYNLAGAILGYGRTVTETTVVEAKKYYLLGQESETLLMPFFLPCDEYLKKVVMLIVDKFETDVKKSGKKKTKKVILGDSAAPSLSESRLSDPYRIQIIKSHRQMTLKQKSMEASVGPGEVVVKFPLIAQTGKKQKGPKIFENCKRMYLQEMETFDDKVFVGRFVTVTVIEDPLDIFCLNLVVEDEKGTPQRVSLCEPALLKNRPVHGAKIRLYNPYYRIARDGVPTLRMEDPESVELESIDPSLCRSCCAPGAGFTCAKCKKAKYCNTGCQANDWKNFGHKLICD